MIHGKRKLLLQKQTVCVSIWTHHPKGKAEIAGSSTQIDSCCTGTGVSLNFALIKSCPCSTLSSDTGYGFYYE